MYVVPFCMGPIGSHIAQIGVQVTDSPYVVVSMRIMTRMGTPALRSLGATASSSAPPLRGRSTGTRPRGRALAVQQDKYIVPFPRDARDLVVRLRLRRQRAARQEVLRAAHRLVHGSRRGLARRAHAHPQLDSPEGETTYVAAAFPSACGKTNFAMMPPDPSRLEGRDRRRRHRLDALGEDGRLCAINPEAGFFGVAPGTNIKTNPNAMTTM